MKYSVYILLHQLQFFDDVDEFLEYRPNGLIGVHGTDSVNRPGYLIARYLIEKFSWDPNVAIKVRLFRKLVILRNQKV